jgi:hypothetical protein
VQKIHKLGCKVKKRPILNTKGNHTALLNSIRKAPILCNFPFPTAFFLKSLPPDTYDLSSTPTSKSPPFFIPDSSFFIGTFAVYILSMRKGENRLYQEYATIGTLKTD